MSKSLEGIEGEIRVIGLPLSVRFLEQAWIAQIEWSYPDYSTARATGRANSMLEAIELCLVDYDRQQ